MVEVLFTNWLGKTINSVVTPDKGYVSHSLGRRRDEPFGWYQVGLEALLKEGGGLGVLLVARVPNRPPQRYSYFDVPKGQIDVVYPNRTAELVGRPRVVFINDADLQEAPIVGHTISGTLAELTRYREHPDIPYPAYL